MTPLVMTGKAAKYAEEFEMIDKQMNSEILELTEDEQVAVYMFNQMVVRDETFKDFMVGTIELFSIATALKKVSILYEKMKEAAEQLKS